MSLLKLRVVFESRLRLFLPAAHTAVLPSGRIFPLSFSAGVSALASVLRNEKNEAKTGPWKKGIGRSRRAHPTRKSPPRQAEAKFFSGNSEP
ncbi:MAG: hypothetical protein EA344_04460 [Alkalicoccus sp.]|nr:MAG: hypothetical protein EA344_04460 [Alkalicoccus sp.]